VKRVGVVVAFLAFLISVPAAAAPSLVAKISLSQQRMTVMVNGVPHYTWLVSTAARGYRTPVGTFRPQRLERMWYSRKYDLSPMPYSVFFRGGYAVHGTPHVKRLGRPASHGCVRLAPANAARLYALVRQYGMANSRIIVTR
jgi:lipoprotein-anchoring transpeptidase ErfK/SrfK